MNIFRRSKKEEHFHKVFNDYTFQIYELSKTRKNKSLQLGEEFWNKVYIISYTGGMNKKLVREYNVSDLFGLTIETPLQIIKIPKESTATFLHPFDNIEIIDKKHE